MDEHKAYKNDLTFYYCLVTKMTEYAVVFLRRLRRKMSKFVSGKQFQKDPIQYF